jgi:hypothetical protein
LLGRKEEGRRKKEEGRRKRETPFLCVFVSLCFPKKKEEARKKKEEKLHKR